MDKSDSNIPAEKDQICIQESEEPPSKRKKKNQTVLHVQGITVIKDEAAKAPLDPVNDTSSQVETEGGSNKETSEVENEEKFVAQKKVRRRKKALYAKIRSQMEFYFSDANLSKDRFMQNTIKENPEVLISTFMSFNKVRSLTEDVKEVVKALKYSTALKLTDNDTRVSRIAAFRPKSQDEVDLCTIYVEHLPPNATIEWITKVFSEFGTVAYVSLPKFNKDPTKNKGFAFVEFCDADSALKAIKAYETSGSYATLVEDPGKLCSIQAFNLESGEGEANFREGNNPEKPEAEEEEDESPPQSKKAKIDEEIKKVEEQEMVEKDEEKEETKPGKTKRQKKRSSTSSLREEIHLEAQTLSLQVMSKKDWKKLRNKYLDMQRKCFRQLRMNAKREAYNKFNSNSSSPREPVRQASLEESKPEPPEVTDIQDFQPGVIVKIVLDEPVSDAKRFKSQVKCQDGVSYVEAQEGHVLAFVRCTDASAAKSLVSKNIWNQSEVLGGEEEQDYWRKIEENRTKKRERTSGARAKKSGAERAKQKKLAGNPTGGEFSCPNQAKQHKNLHIRFDDSD